MENTVFFARTRADDLSAQVRLLLARALGETPELVFGPHGKPYLADGRARISLTHTRGAVACALSDARVGIDLEGPRSVRPGLAARCFTAREQAYAVDEARFLEVWTRKEALLKRDGEGLTVPLNRLETVGRPDLATRRVGEYVLSFCGSPAAFRLVEVHDLKDSLL